MRESGILMHISSLPGSCGIGTMGKAAYEFVDFLEKAGQRAWQILPLTPTGYGDSPYQSCSAFGGNHYLIDLDALVEEGLLNQEDIGRDWCDDPGRVDFGRQYRYKLDVLRTAFSRFSRWQELDDFCEKNRDWLPDFALYLALRDANGGKPWYQWEEGLKFRREAALAQAREACAHSIRFYCFVQYLFYSQWFALKRYASERGIRIIGDVPIYVPMDSCEVWCAPALFQLDADMNPVAVAGCPPDAFSDDGQLWGNPLYRWEAHRESGFAWWIRRLRAAGDLYDTVRIDHFRAFEAYWAVPYGDETARGGQWCKGPGMDFIRAVREALPHVRMIAEDLGFLTPEVLQLRDDSGYPGMKVLQFAFDDPDYPSPYLPHNHIPNTVCYTGTHDNMTTRQWLENLPRTASRFARDYMALTEDEGLTWGVIRTAMASVSDLCVIPMQDYLDLGGEARMNFPGTMTGNNWTWRAQPGFCRDDLAEKIRTITKRYGRCR